MKPVHLARINRTHLIRLAAHRDHGLDLLIEKFVHILANQPDWSIISSHNFKEKIYATPVIDRDRIYVRTEKALYCF